MVEHQRAAKGKVGSMPDIEPTLRGGGKYCVRIPGNRGVEDVAFCLLLTRQGTHGYG